MAAIASPIILVWDIDLEAFPVIVASGWEEILTPRERTWLEHPRGPWRARARAALRLILGEAANRAPEALTFERGPHGKPSLAEPAHNNGAQLHYNLSHSRGRALVALAEGLEVGVDVEARRPVPNWPAIARRAFHTEEIAHLQSLPSAEAETCFLDLYAGKEAVAKALGVGMGRTFRRFTLPPVGLYRSQQSPPAPIEVPSDLADGREWAWRSLPAIAGYAAAICAEGHQWRVSLRAFQG